jgi:hypothetical protein
MSVYGQMGRKDDGVDPGESHQVKTLSLSLNPNPDLNLSLSLSLSLRLHQFRRALLRALP